MQKFDFGQFIQAGGIENLVASAERVFFERNLQFKEDNDGTNKSKLIGFFAIRRQ